LGYGVKITEDQLGLVLVGLFPARDCFGVEVCHFCKRSWNVEMRHLQNGTFCPISASASNFNPRNILYIPVVEIFAFLELEQKLLFFKGLEIRK